MPASATTLKFGGVDFLFGTLDITQEYRNAAEYYEGGSWEVIGN
jgi:hypothetical protein